MTPCSGVSSNPCDTSTNIVSDGTESFIAISHYLYESFRWKDSHILGFPSAYRNFDRMRRDGLVMGELTKSKYVLDIYAFCGTSGLFEYADGGDIEETIWPSDGTESHLSQLDKLHMGTY